MPLPKVHRVVQDSLGNVVPQVLCSVLLEGTGTLATLWQDDAGTIPLSNPMTSDATYGSFGFYVEPGHYDLTFTKPGYTFQPLLDVQVPQDDLTLGTMAQQDASAVAITGGTITGVSSPGMGLGALPAANARLYLEHPHASHSGIVTRPSDADTGVYPTMLFLNLAGVQVGSIAATAAATAFNTTSDARLKRDVTPLTGALDVVRRLNPITFKWKSTDESAEGFLGHELQQVVPHAVTGQPDAVNEDGSINPLQVDYSKLVPFLAAAVKELMARVEVLEQALA